MKKQVYISPKTEIITIAAHSMICISGVDVGEKYSSETTTTLSRQGSSWDDEEE